MTTAPIHTILHPTDFSDDSQYAFETALALARDYGARMIVLHVIPAPESPAWAGEGVTGVTACWPLYSRADVEKALGKLQASSPKVRVEQRIRDGEPAEEILRVADEEHCNLIVMGTQGKTGLERLLLGSVAEQVMRRARCPLLAVRPAARVKLPSAREQPAPVAAR